MNAVITYSRYGGPDVLSLSDADIPEPGPGQVRIRVRAVAVNPIDAKIRSGRMDGIFPIQFPVLPGWDVAGVVDAAGPGAAAAAGDEVFGVASAGGYSQYALLDRPVPKPAALPAVTAAALVTVGEAAFRVLKHLGLTAGQTLVILGAGGSVGTIAVQLATARGIRVIGTAADGDLGLAAPGWGPPRSGTAMAGRSASVPWRPAGWTPCSTRPGPAPRRDQPGRRPGARHHHRRRQRRGPRRPVHRRGPGGPRAGVPAGTGRPGGQRRAHRSGVADLPARGGRAGPRRPGRGPQPRQARAAPQARAVPCG